MMSKYDICKQEAQGLFDEHEMDITGLSNAFDVYAKEVALAFYEHEESVPPDQMSSNFDVFYKKSLLK